MNLDHRNDRNAFGQREVGSSEESSHLNPAQRSHYSYGRDNASMRGNDFYGTHSYNNDYSRGNYSASTYGAGRSRQGGYAPSEARGMEKKYVEFPDYSNRPTYGSYAGSRAYTDYIDHNYGYAWTKPESARYNASTSGQQVAPKSGSRSPFRSVNQSRYSDNDGRRR